MVLANRDWAESPVSLSDTSVQIATAFARYPYPESFFMWRAGDSDVRFFNRADRYPAWMSHGEERGYPVVVETNPPGSDKLRQRVDAFAASRSRYVAFNTALGDQPYQVIARLTYGDSQQEALGRSSVSRSISNGCASRISAVSFPSSRRSPAAGSTLRLTL